MKYAIIESIGGSTPTVKSTGSIKELFPNTSFTATGPNADFLTENKVVELVETLTYTSPTQKLVSVEPYLDGGKAYNVRVESTTTDEQSALNTTQWQVVRTHRNNLLRNSDWRAGSDVTLSDEWKTYRQALRDVPTKSDPFNVTWPTMPS